MPKKSKTPPAFAGQCGLCKQTFGKRGMGKHLETCLRSQAEAARAVKGTPAEVNAFHLAVSARYLPEYWLHLLAGPKVTLDALDGFLRQIWLETYDHLSAFTIGDTRLDSGPPFGDVSFEVEEDDEEEDVFENEDEDEELEDYAASRWDARARLESMANLLGIRFNFRMPDEPLERNMNVVLAEVLQPKLKFKYEYDFGTTMELALTVVGQLPADIKRGEIRLLAPNDPPEIPCDICGKPATMVCSECLYDDAGWLCKKCARKHECGEEMLEPVANTPRTGIY